MPGPTQGNDRDVTRQSAGAAQTATPSCQFTLVPPRHFLYPAILLLLAERPRHGYRLVDGLLAIGFGPVERSSVYRALGQLGRDGLLDSWSAEPTAGSTRHVYAPSELGRRVLEEWMAVLTQQRDTIDRVLKRYDTVIDDD